MYGHIVAGNIGTGFAYIVPAQNIRRESFLQDFTLARTQDYRKVFGSNVVSPLPLQEEQFKFGKAHVRHEKHERHERYDSSQSEEMLGGLYSVTWDMSKRNLTWTQASSGEFRRVKDTLHWSEIKLEDRFAPHKAGAPDFIVPLKVTTTEGTWPSPEVSLGQWVTKVGPYSVWEVSNPADVTWRQLQRRLEELIDYFVKHQVEREEEYYPKDGFLSWGIYMIGETSSFAMPTWLVSSNKRIVGAMARHMLWRMAKRDNFGVRFAIGVTE